MSTKHKITVALTTCLLMTPALMAGAWFAGCTLRTWQKWNTDAYAKSTVWIPTFVGCVVPGPYYDAGNTRVCGT